jgi:phospholipase C
MGFAPTLLSAVQRAFAVEPTPGTTWEDAEHIVFLMQENRSFDHVFGSLQGVRGFNDPRAITLPSGLPVWCQAAATGEVYTPFRLDLKGTRATWMGDLPHNWLDQVDARNGGQHDRWLPNKTRTGQPPLTLGYYTRADLPFYYAFADAFTVCDQHFCSTLTGTTSNRLYFWSGTNREAQTPEGKPHVYNSDSDHSGILKWTSYPERLTRQGIPWKVYQNQLSVATGLGDEEAAWLGNFGDNPLEYFAAYRVRFAAGHSAYLTRQVQDLPAAIERATVAAAARPQDKKLADELATLKGRLESAQTELLTWRDEDFEKLSEEQRTLHQQAFVTNALDPLSRRIGRTEVSAPGGSKTTITAPQGDVLAQFRADVTGGKLPPISWLVAPKNFSDHPSAPWFGAWYVSEVLNILSADPARWRKTILVLTYDENDGLFDHQPPFVAPRMDDPATGACSAGVDSTLDFTTRDRTSPLGLGYRVPMIIASPWTRGGWVNSQVFDHTSSLRLLERFVQRRFGKEVREDNLTSWRRTVGGDLTSVFRPWQGEAVPTPEFLDQRTWLATIVRAKQQPPADPGKPLSELELAQIRSDPAASPRLPRQEPGTRPANALPYDVMVDGALEDDRRSLRLDFHSLTRLFRAATAGCPFQVTAPGRVIAAGSPSTGERVWQDGRIWDYAVAPGSRLSANWALADFTDQRYHLRVNGPNGFLREFRGTPADPPLRITADTEVDVTGAPTGNLRLKLTLGVVPAGLRLRITANAYGQPDIVRPLAANQETTVSLPLERSYGWYDVTLTVEGASDFARRYAGRIETGRSSRTDPLMGREHVG